MLKQKIRRLEIVMQLGQKKKLARIEVKTETKIKIFSMSLPRSPIKKATIQQILLNHSIQKTSCNFGYFPRQ